MGLGGGGVDCVDASCDDLVFVVLFCSETVVYTRSLCLEVLDLRAELVVCRGCRGCGVGCLDGWRRCAQLVVQGLKVGTHFLRETVKWFNQTSP